MEEQQKIGGGKILNDIPEDDDGNKTWNMEYEKNTLQEENFQNRDFNSTIFFVERSTYNEEENKRDRRTNSKVTQNQDSSDSSAKSDENVTNVFSSNGRKWIILIAAFIAVALSLGFPFYLSVLYVEWLAEFGKSNSETAVVQSFCNATFAFGGFISGIIVTKFGPRMCCMASGMFAAIGISVSYFATSITYLVFSIGLLSGFSFSLAYISTVVIVGIYFEGKKKSLALAFITCGSGFGGAVYPAVLEQLIGEYGWRGTILIMAGMMLNLVVIGCLYKSPMNENKKYGKKGDNNSSSLTGEVKAIDKQGPINVKTGDSQMVIRDSTKCKTEIRTNVKQAKLKIDSERDCNKRSVSELVKELFKNKLFLCFCFTLGVCQSTMFSIYTFFVDYYTFKGLTRSNVVTYYFYMNLLSTLSRLAPGFLKQLRHVSVFSMPMLSSLIGCLSVVLFTCAGPSFTLNLVASLGYGLAVGCLRTSTVICIAKLVGKENYAAGLGLSISISGFFNLAVGPISGFLKDTTGDYDAYTIFIAVTLFLSSLLFFIIMIYRYLIERDKRLKVHSSMSRIESIKSDQTSFVTHF